MAEIAITQAKVDDAINFLATYLSEKVTEGDFRKGSMLFDIVITAISYSYAYLQAEAGDIRDRQSLLKIQQILETEEDLDDAVDEILSNFYIGRKTGNYTRVVAQLHFSAQEDIPIATGTKFWRTAICPFVIDSDTSIVIPATDLIPIQGSDGVIVDYVANVSLRSVLKSDDFDFEPGRFIRVDPFNAYFTYAEHQDSCYGSEGREDSETLINRAGDSLTVRNLINDQSCNTVLIENYPDTITTTKTFGMSDPEMVRDRVDDVSYGLQAHIGGHHDTYVEMPIIITSETGVIGSTFTRPDGIISVFRDSDLAGGFISQGVVAGQVLYIKSGIAGAPRGFVITVVRTDELEISDLMPFSDETGSTVVYQIGRLSPNFDDIVGETTAASNEGTSRKIKTKGRIVLSGKPIQDIRKVEIIDPDSSGADSDLIDASSGTIVFPNRINGEPITVISPLDLEYQVIVRNSKKAQSAEAVTEVNVGWSGEEDHFDGYTLRVEYLTMQSFATPASYVKTTGVRIVDSNHLIRARYPVFLEMIIPYKLKKTAEENLDTDAAAQSIASFINSFNPDDDLDADDIRTYLREQYAVIGGTFAFDITYTLDSPDGQQIIYSTTDLVTILPDGQSGATLVNGSDIIPALSSNTELKGWLLDMGVTDNVVRYRTTADRILFIQRS